MKNILLKLVAILAFGLTAAAQEVPQVTEGESASVVAPSFGGENNNRGRIAATTVRTNPIVMKVTASRGPLRMSAVDYTAFKANFVAMMNGSTQVGSSPLNKFTPLGNTLVPSYVTAPTIPGSPVGTNTIWYAVELSSSQPFTVPSDLRVLMVSTPNNLFGQSVSFADTSSATQLYDGQSGGEVWNANGTTNKITSGFWNTQPVNRFFFLGVATPTMNDNTQAGADADAQWMLAFPNFKISATYSFTEGDVVTTATKVLETRPATVVTLQIARSTPGKAILTPKGLAGTGSILGKDKLSDSSWTFVTKVTGENTVEIPDSFGMKFYRLTVD